MDFPAYKFDKVDVTDEISPDEIVFSGELISEKVLTEVAEYCSKSVPAKYMPEFRIAADFDEFLINGMFQIAIESKEL